MKRNRLDVDNWLLSGVWIHSFVGLLPPLQFFSHFLVVTSANIVSRAHHLPASVNVGHESVNLSRDLTAWNLRRTGWSNLPEYLATPSIPGIDGNF